MSKSRFAEADDVVLIADPRVTAVPIIENNEPLIDLRETADIAYGAAPVADNRTGYTKVRRTIWTKIREAQQLLPDGIKLCLAEGWRPISVQKRQFEQVYKDHHLAHPTWTQEQCFVEATRLVSPVELLTGEKNVPPHSTAGPLIFT